MRVTKSDIKSKVKSINNYWGTSIYAEWAYGRPKVYETSGTKGCLRELSPRLPTGKLMDWLNGFEHGLEMAKNPKRKPYFK